MFVRTENQKLILVDPIFNDGVATIPFPNESWCSSLSGSNLIISSKDYPGVSITADEDGASMISYGDNRQSINFYFDNLSTIILVKSGKETVTICKGDEFFQPLHKWLSRLFWRYTKIIYRRDL